MSRPKITLDGVLVLAVGNAGWAFTTGVNPPMRVFLVHDSAWGRLSGRMGQEVTLKIGNLATIERLVLVEESPSPKPYYRAVVVSDRRFWWQRVLVLRDYNLRRRQNQYRLEGPELVQLQIPIPSFAFRPASMKDGKEPYHARTLIEDVLEVVEPGNWVIDSLPTVKEKSVTTELGDGVNGRVTVNDQRLRDPGNAAIQRALQMAPGALVWVDATGKVRVFDATDLAESEGFRSELRGGATTAGGVARLINRKAQRPKAVHVYVERELELILRSELETQSPSSTDPVDAPAEGQLLNVAPVPDPTWSDPDSGQLLTMGTYKELKKLVAGWEAERAAAAVADPDGAEVGVLPFTMENVRRYWIQGGIEAAWGGHGDFLATGSGPRRVGCLRSHWRTTYAIEQRIMERMDRVAAVRLALLDQLTRTRAPATVFATYAVALSNKGIYRAQRRKDFLTAVFQNVNAYPNLDGGETWDEKEGVASATLHLIDAELGVFHVSFQGDANGEIDSTYPGYIVRDTDSDNPTADPITVFKALRKQTSEPMILGGRVAEAPGLSLYAGFRVAFIFSGVPGAPNGKERFHKITITPSMVAEELASEFNVQESDGPEWELFAPPNLITARWALVPKGFNMTAYVAALNEVLGITAPAKKDGKKDQNQGGGAGPAGTQGGAAQPQGAAGGGGQGNAGGKDGAAAPADPCPEAPPPWKLLNRGQLIAWAVAQAIPIYASLADRTEGGEAYHMGAAPSDLRLRGGVSSFEYSASPSGRLLASVTFDGPTYHLDPVALLPQWARTELLGVVLDQAKP